MAVVQCWIDISVVDGAYSKQSVSKYRIEQALNICLKDSSAAREWPSEMKTIARRQNHRRSIGLPKNLVSPLWRLVTD